MRPTPGHISSSEDDSAGKISIIPEQSLIPLGDNSLALKESDLQLEMNGLSLAKSALPKDTVHALARVSHYRESAAVDHADEDGANEDHIDEDHTDQDHTDEDHTDEDYADKGHSYMAPLLVAAKAGNVEDVLRLVDSDAAAEMCGAPITSALHEAAVADRVEVINLLLDRGFDVNLRRGGSYTRLVIGREATALHLAAAYGRLAVIKLLIRRGANLLAKDAKDRTPLHAAATWGQVAALRLLVSGMMKAGLRVGDIAGNTALEYICTSWSCAKESPTMVQILLNSGAKPFLTFKYFASNKLYLIPLLLHHHEPKERLAIWTRALDHCLDSLIAGFQWTEFWSTFVLSDAVRTLLQYGKTRISSTMSNSACP